MRLPLTTRRPPFRCPLSLLHRTHVARARFHTPPVPAASSVCAFLARLEGCRHLRALDLGKNRIAKVEGIAHLEHLAQLSLEDNQVAQLGGIAPLRALMELCLYAGTSMYDLLSSPPSHIL